MLHFQNFEGDGMEFLYDFGSFAGKALIITFAILLVIIVIANIAQRIKPGREHIEVEDLNAKFDSFSNHIRSVTEDHRLIRKELKKKSKAKRKSKKKGLEKDKKIVYVVDFQGDIKASETDTFRDEITSILAHANAKKDEVVVRLESTGGMVHAYGLAASQLQRIKDKGIKLTVCVDKVAASGGYMMACTADQILAAPFAIIGSIGVIAQVPNFHKILRKHDVDYEEITAGEFKRTISLLGEITEKGRQKFLEQIEDTHKLFKDFVQKNRPQLDISKVATGEYWYGHRAKELHLVDQLIASDDYLFQFKDEARVIRIDISMKKKLGDKMAEFMQNSIEKLYMKWWQQLFESSLFNR